MNVISETVDLEHQRVRVFKPAGPPRRWPAVLAWSDIFQHTPPHVRMCTRLAAHGYVVAAPELYGRFEPRGTVLRFEEDRQRALDDAAKMQLSWFDDDRAALLAHVTSRPDVDAAALFATGWCIGGHLAFRAAVKESRLKATACFYATGLHSDSLGGAVGTAKTLSECGNIAGPLLLVWGTRDPHIPAEGRDAIHRALTATGRRFLVREYDAEHTFMRDEGARWEPAAADQAFREMLELFSR
ncbi:MAG: dienelactone hydrolase family protein [Myxococcaceae bacterium]